jgi:PAS domain S-box-containing protein
MSPAESRTPRGALHGLQVHPAPAAEHGRGNAVLRAVAYAAETFLRSERLEESIPGVLRRLGEAAAASRVYVFECHDVRDRRRWSHRYEWVAPGIGAQIDNPDLRDVAFDEIGFGRWERALLRGEVIEGPVRGYPLSERALLAEQDILSLAVVPIFLEGRLWGFIGFDDCWRARVWSPAVLTALRTAADLFGAMLMRRELEERYRCLSDASAEGIVIHDGHAILDVNASFLRMLGYTREEVFGTDPVELLDPASREEVAARTRTRSTEAYDVVLRRRDGSTFPRRCGAG